MKIIVGLGNPGRKYKETRHNVGFMVADKLAHRHQFETWRRRFHSLAAEGCIGGAKVMLMKPQTLMNESGRAAQEALHWCRVALQDTMIVCDDFNLSLGRIRVRGSGSSGGHNGLVSVMEKLVSEEIPRLRVGIGGQAQGNDRDYVLSSFGSREREVIDESIERAARALEVWLESGLERCQNEFNADPAPRNQREEADA